MEEVILEEWKEGLISLFTKTELNFSPTIIEISNGKKKYAPNL
jgi:hypothetical protein